MSNKLSWIADSQRRCQKDSKAFYLLKCYVSVLSSFRTKQNAYVGYVMPVISYASMVWFVNKRKELERIQKKDTEWI